MCSSDLTKDGRSLSRWRYHRAEGFFPDNETRSIGGWHRFLYFSGITAQLGLSAHLLDVGFPDEWNARYVGLRVARSEEHTSELQSLMRISYAVFCLKKQT